MSFKLLVILVLAIYLASLSLTREQSYCKGGPFEVPRKLIDRYLKKLYRLSDNYNWHPTIKKLAKVVKKDSALRYNWNYGISQAENLKKYTSKEVFDILNAILNVGPSYNSGGLVGFPINVVFVDLMQQQNGRTLFSNDKFNNALKGVLNAYGAMLVTNTSLTFMNNGTGGWFSPKAQKKINYTQFQCDPSQPHYGFPNWNEWFLRKFKPGMRPLRANTPPNVDPFNVIIDACQSTPLLNPLQPSRDVEASAPFWLKGNLYSLVDIFGDYGNEKGYGGLFVGGTVLQAFLSSLSYHHWHAPVSGQIVDIYTLPGTYYLGQSQFHVKHDPSPPDMSQSFISHTAARMVYVIKADNPRLGYVGLVFIGMAECSGVSNSTKIGDHVQQGDHIGNFLFGGSSYMMLFQNSANLKFTDTLYNKDKDGNLEERLQPVLSYLATIE